MKLFSKNFFRLRRKGVKRRKSGYYWVKWSYSFNTGNTVWRIAYYLEPWHNWQLPGDVRYFKDEDFLEIGGKISDDFTQTQRFWWAIIFLNLGIILERVFTYFLCD